MQKPWSWLNEPHEHKFAHCLTFVDPDAIAFLGNLRAQIPWAQLEKQHTSLNEKSTPREVTAYMTGVADSLALLRELVEKHAALFQRTYQRPGMNYPYKVYETFQQSVDQSLNRAEELLTGPVVRKKEASPWISTIARDLDHYLLGLWSPDRGIGAAPFGFALAVPELYEAWLKTVGAKEFQLLPGVGPLRKLVSWDGLPIERAWLEPDQVQKYVAQDPSPRMSVAEARAALAKTQPGHPLIYDDTWFAQQLVQMGQVLTQVKACLKTHRGLAYVGWIESIAITE